MISEFDEGIDSDQDPLDGRHTDFPYAELSCFAEAEPQPIDRAAFMVHLLVWLRGNVSDFSPEANKAARMRLDALMWTLRPNYYPGSPSLTKLAHRMHIDESALSRMVADVTRRFGIRNRGQSHGDGARKP